MKSFWQYLAGVLAGIGIGIWSAYYFGVSGRYVQPSTSLTLLVGIIGLNFLALGIIIGAWRYKRGKRG